MNYWFVYKTTDGSIYNSPYLGHAEEWTNIPDGCAVLGPIADTDTTAQDAWANPSYYQVQNGALVKTATDAQLLSDAKTTQTALIEQAYTSAMAAGFTSLADGTARVYGWQTTDALNLDLVQSAIDHGIEAFPVAYADLAGETVSITDQTMLTALDKDASTFAWANTTKRRALLAQIKAATTVADVQAVAW